MRPSIVRSSALAISLALALAGTALADLVTGDADLVTAGTQATRDLGEVAPGAVIIASIGFELRCRNTAHVDAGQSVVMVFNSAIVPSGGSVEATSATIGPPPASWPADGTGCPSPVPTLSAATPSNVTLTAPTTPGGPYTYTVMYRSGLEPAGTGDSSAVNLFASASLTLTVVGNTPPVLTLPADFTVEADRAGGAAPTWDAAASDAEDDPDPPIVCDPPSGSFLPLGTTTVTCSATDSGGLSASGSFAVTVADATPPSLDVPADLVVGTTDPAGRTVDYAPPVATDIADAAPAVDCVPAPGAWFPVGTTVVTCQATDASGNATGGSFQVTVVLYGATFDAPIGPSNVLDVHGGRTIPVKVSVTKDGVVQTGGLVLVALAPCAGGESPTSTPLEWRADSGRWFGLVDASGLLAGCWRGTVTLDGVGAGWFDLAVTADTSSVARRRAA